MEFFERAQNEEIGRVLRASTTGFAVGCRVNQLSKPGFGSLVKAQPIDQREVIYGLIYDIQIDDDQLIQRLVMTENARPEVINDQRQNRMLPIEMSVLTLGYSLNGVLRHGLPPRPPLNLDPVLLCAEPREIEKFTTPSERGNLNYLRLILRAPANRVAIDQLLIAHIGDVYHKRGQDQTWALQAVAELIDLLRSNYDLLMPTLEGLSELLPDLPISDLLPS